MLPVVIQFDDILMLDSVKAGHLATRIVMF